VPKYKTSAILNPVAFLAQLRNSDDTTPLEYESVVLTERLVEATGIDWNDIGITGSQLVGVAEKDSDTDLVVYGSSACRKFYSGLCAKIDNIPGIRKYSGQLLENHTSFRWEAHSELHPLLQEIEQAKLLQGLIGNYHFFIRLVKTPADLDYDYGDFSYQMKGYQKITGKILSSQDSIFTPCEYQVKCDNTKLEKLVSYRGRFTEHVSTGDQFEAFGRVELVTDHRTSEQFLQLVLGESPEDYLIPLR
jgi:predicted nucleotidyltransferase